MEILNSVFDKGAMETTISSGNRLKRRKISPGSDVCEGISSIAGMNGGNRVRLSVHLSSPRTPASASLFRA